MSASPRSVFAALLLALGLLGAGWFAAQGMAKLRTADRYVTVKGSAEKLVDADLAVWPITFTVNGNDLAGVQAGITRNATTVREFLAKAGFGANEITTSPTKVEDRWAYSYGSDRPPERYRATSFLNGVRISSPQRLNNGDLITLAEATVMSFEWPDQAKTPTYSAYPQAESIPAPVPMAYQAAYQPAQKPIPQQPLAPAPTPEIKPRAPWYSNFFILLLIAIIIIMIIVIFMPTNWWCFFSANRIPGCPIN